MGSGSFRDDYVYIYIYIDAAVMWALAPLGMTMYIYIYIYIDAAVMLPLDPLGMTLYIYIYTVVHYIHCCYLFCLKAVILCHLFRFICTFLTKAACCRNIEIVLHTTTLSIYIYTYRHRFLSAVRRICIN